MDIRGVRFDEKMAGRLAVPRGDLVDSDPAWFALRAAVVIDDLDRFVSDPAHRGRLVGHVDFPPFGRNIPANGHVELFAGGNNPHSRVMRYRASFELDGIAHEMIGTKYVSRDRGFNAWGHTTTLFTTIMRYGAQEPVPLAAGVIRLTLWQGVRMLLTLRGAGPSWAARVGAVGGFARFFVAQVVGAYVFTGKPSRRRS